MSADEHLNPQQFSYYRGLHLPKLVRSSRFVPPGESHVGIGHMEPVEHDINDDAHALSLLKPSGQPDNPRRPTWPLYGTHWTENPHLAHQFALDESHGRFRAPRMPKAREVYGAVLEARSSVAPQRDDLSSEYGESEVKFPHRDAIDSVVMHLHKYDPNLGHQWAKHSHLRSIEVPEDKWRNA